MEEALSYISTLMQNQILRMGAIIWGGIVLVSLIIYTRAARERGITSPFGYIICAMLGPFGIPFGLLLPSDPSAREIYMIRRGYAQKCPQCAELVRSDATVCHYCGFKLPTAMGTPQRPGDAEWQPSEEWQSLVSEWETLASGPDSPSWGETTPRHENKADDLMGNLMSAPARNKPDIDNMQPLEILPRQEETAKKGFSMPKISIKVSKQSVIYSVTGVLLFVISLTLGVIIAMIFR